MKPASSSRNSGVSEPIVTVPAAPRPAAAEQAPENMPAAQPFGVREAPTRLSPRGVHSFSAPARAPRRRLSLVFFLLLVGLPGILAAYYYGAVASDQYVTDIQFGVKSADAQRNDASSMFQGMAAASQIGLQSNILVQYMKSREIVDSIDRELDLRGRFSGSAVDWLSRLAPGAPNEELVAYWRGKVAPYFEQTTGIISVRVRAFTPQDALAIGKAVITRSERLSEDLSRRARTDYVRFATEQVDDATARLSKVRQELLEFRDKEMTLDPTKEADVARLGIAKLREEAARVQTDMATVQAQLGETSPIYVSLRYRLNALQSQVKEAEAKLMGSAGPSSNPMSRNMRGYEALQTERVVAEKLYDMALQSLERAQFEANRQSWYLEVFVHPALAEQPLYPRRLISTLIVVLVGFGTWMFLLMIYHSIREHV